MNENEEQLQSTRKALKYGGITYIVVLILAQWYATQSVAEQCNYNSLLGSYLSIGDMKLYFPLKYFFWSINSEISAAIPAILAPYDSMYMASAILAFGVFYFIKKSSKVATEHGSASFATAQDIIDSGLGDTVKVDNPADVLRNQMWEDVHNFKESFFTINALPEDTKEQRTVKQKRFQNYWTYFKKNRPADTEEQKRWDYEHNLSDYKAYANSLEEGAARDAIELRISELENERNELPEEEKIDWDNYHDLRKWQESSADYKDSKLRREVWEKSVAYILKNRPLGTDKQQKWDLEHSVNDTIKKIQAIIKDIDEYVSEHRPKPETEEEKRRFAISKNPKPTEKQLAWDAFHNLKDTIEYIKSTNNLSITVKKEKLKEIQEYIEKNAPKDKQSEEYKLWWRYHGINKAKATLEANLKKWKDFITKSCPKPKEVNVPKNSGVVVGINPYTHKLMLHDGVEHILLMAPTRSGKGVSTIIPTGLIWKHSMFFFDPKGELWGLTSGYRKNILRQKVLKFQPLCKDGSAARWNPLAEINYRSFEELSDVQSITGVMVRPDGENKGGDDFWPNSAQALLNGVIMHLLYKHDKENLPLPCPSDIMSFLSTPGKSTDDLFKGMKIYPHISEEEFMETPILDENGNEQYDEHGLVIRRKNPLKEIYGDYVLDYSEYTEALGVTVRSIDEIRTVIQYKRDQGETIPFEYELDGLPTGVPFYQLLVHPKVAECAANILNGADQTRASILQTAQTSLAIYQDPVVQANTAVSDFAIRDLLDPQQEVSLYLVMEVKDIAAVKPIARLFIQMICSKLIQDMKFGSAAKGLKKQRLLLMLDEFPQLGNMKCIELALAICAGYGIKMCIVAQDVNQLNKEYTKDNSIGSNCHLHIYFTPNIDSGGATAESISKQLGKKTIKTVSHSDGGGGFFKGSDSTSSTGRELMTPDEVSHMSSEKELVFVAGHKPIFGDKLRYYKQDWLLRRTKIDAPTTSDTVTRILDYETMFKIRDAEVKSKEKDRLKVIADKASKEGLTLKQYLLKEEQRKEKREKEIISALKGDKESDEHEQNNEVSENTKPGTGASENEQRSESSAQVSSSDQVKMYESLSDRHFGVMLDENSSHQQPSREKVMAMRRLKRRQQAMVNSAGYSHGIPESDLDMAEELYDNSKSAIRPGSKFSMDVNMPTNQQPMQKPVQETAGESENNNITLQKTDTVTVSKNDDDVNEPVTPQESTESSEKQGNDVQEPSKPVQEDAKEPSEPAEEKKAETINLGETDIVNLFKEKEE